MPFGKDACRLAMSQKPLIRETRSGLYCEQGDFFIDPWRKVDRAIVTHAHADHARPGSAHYLCSREGLRVTRSRLGPSARIESLEFGEKQLINGVSISLFPAGHILGSAQVRVEYGGEVWVVSGDYKVEPDPTCSPFEPVRCHKFITESTFGLPVYRWPSQEDVAADLNEWWIQCRDQSQPAVLFAYSLGKAQRVLALVNPGIGPIYCHTAVETLNQEYRASGIALPETQGISGQPRGRRWGGNLIVAPPGAADSAWMGRLGSCSRAMASGWMLTRAGRRWNSLDRGFPISDHADWPGLLWAINETGAEEILVTHGQTEVMVKYLQEQGISARALKTRFGDEADQ